MPVNAFCLTEDEMSDEVLRKVDVDWLLSIYGALLTD